MLERFLGVTRPAGTCWSDLASTFALGRGYWLLRELVEGRGKGTLVQRGCVRVRMVPLEREVVEERCQACGAGHTAASTYQLRNDDRLKEESFRKMMALSFKYVPLLRRRESEGGKQRHAAEGLRPPLMPSVGPTSRPFCPVADSEAWRCPALPSMLPSTMHRIEVLKRPERKTP